MREEADLASNTSDQPRIFRQEATLQAETVHLAVSQAYADEITHFADRGEEREDGGEVVVVGRGRCRIIIRALTIDCKTFTLRLRPAEPDSPPDFLLVASGGIVWKTGREVTRASTMLADHRTISFEGDFQLDVQR